MSGGVAQLVAIGAQDAHLVGNPEVSFFRSQYKRHTNFSTTVERQVIQGNPAPGGMSSIRFERKGDLLSYVYLTKKATYSNDAKISAFFNSSDIAKVELLIGGQVIDTIDNEFSLEIAIPLLSSVFSKTTFANGGEDQGRYRKMYPLNFWFCEHFQSALPLICLQYHDVEIRITWGPLSIEYPPSFEVWAKYIYLDTSERENLVKNPQNMLIYQNQKAIASGTNIQELNFNHPVKFLASTSNLFQGSPYNEFIKLQINGIDIGDSKPQDPHYIRTPYHYHTDTVYASNAISNPDTYSRSKFLYPFCLNTNKLQPTGTLNFSRLDSARLIGSNVFTSTVYGVNYNVLKIQNGMGGLLYAN
jgi:hypothetical protein